jgi:hypothetical protein
VRRLTHVGTQGDSFFSIMYADEALSNGKFFPPGALEAFVSANQHLPLPPWITPEEKATRSDIFSCSPGPIFAGRSTTPSVPSSTDLPPGYHGPTNWYRALVNNLAVAEEKSRRCRSAHQMPCVNDHGNAWGSDNTAIRRHRGAVCSGLSESKSQHQGSLGAARGEGGG